MRQISRFLLAATFTAFAVVAFFDGGLGKTARHSGYLVYVGTYTRQLSKGIYAFRFDPTGTFRFAANQGSNSVVLFRINARTGQLVPTGEIVEAPAPFCIVFVES